MYYCFFVFSGQQLAIEASKKESEREERRRRYKRREAKAGKAEAEEQQQRLDEFQQTLKKVDDAMESVMAAETLTLESTRKKADQVYNPSLELFG